MWSSHIKYSRPGTLHGSQSSSSSCSNTPRKFMFPVPVRAGESGLVRQVRPRPASARSFSTPTLNLVLTRGLLSFLPVSLMVHPVNRHRVSPELIGPRDCLPTAFRREPAGTGPAVLINLARVTDAAYSGSPVDQLRYAPLFLHPLLYTIIDTVDM